MTDWQLIQEFVGQDSQAAFAELLRRYMDLVYCTCLRELNEPTLAEDTAQAVFLILVRKAPLLRPNRQQTTLAGWLFRTALFTSRNVLRREKRRQAREQEAIQMQQSQTGESPERTQAELLLNEALWTLPVGQRALLVERFFQQRPLAEIGAERGISEDAARMRVNRALDRLRRFFAAHDVALSAAALAVVLGQAIRPAPARCAETLLREKLSSSAWASHSQIIAQGAIHAMNVKRFSLQLGAVILVASLSLGTVGAVRIVRQVKARAIQAQKQQEQARALAVLDRMYASYAAMHSFRCYVTSREDPLGTAQDAVYEIERPNRIRFHRVTLLGPDMSGQALAVSDGHALYVTCTENKGLADRYAKLPLDPARDNSEWLSDFGGLPAWGTEPYAGQPGAALGIRLQNAMSLSAPEYSLGQPTVIDFPGIARPVPVDVVVARMHHLSPVGTMKDDPEVVTYYVGQRDHLLYKVTAAYMIGPTDWDTRTETYDSIEVDPKLASADFVFTPAPGSHEVPDTGGLFPDGSM